MRCVSQTLIVGAVGLCMLLAVASPVQAEGAERSVVVRSAQLRSSPQHWGASVASVKYGDRLTVIASEADWLSVRSESGTVGFIHQTAVSERPVLLAAGKQGTAPPLSESEIVLAGKGFSGELEAALGEKEKELRFDFVDAMERRTISRDELLTFLKDGGLYVG